MANYIQLPLDILEKNRIINNLENHKKYKDELSAVDLKIIVLDDDPTGIQTVHDVSVYTDWTINSIRKGFLEEGNMFFVLTNSRSFTLEETIQVHKEIANNISSISKELNMDFLLISRGDSTLRGHYPLETMTLIEAFEQESISFESEIICPFFLEGGRYTIDNIHYVKQNDQLIPAHLTEFAKDKTFGYTDSHLGDYIESQSKGRFKSNKCLSIDLSMLQNLEYEKIEDILMQASLDNKIIVNATSYEHLEVFSVALFRVISRGKRFMFRSAASLPKILGGIADQPILKHNNLVNETNTFGGVVIVGSHVKKTTQQLEMLMESNCNLEFMEFDASKVKIQGGLEKEVEHIVTWVDTTIQKGTTAVVYTSRKLLEFDSLNPDEVLKASVAISEAVTSIVGKMTIKPRFILAKGGITSSDVGTKALRVKRAIVMGQVQPGIPVWMTGNESKFPNMPYIIFPGNVGEVVTLKEIVEELS